MELATLGAGEVVLQTVLEPPGRLFGRGRAGVPGGDVVEDDDTARSVGAGWPWGM